MMAEPSLITQAAQPGWRSNALILLGLKVWHLLFDSVRTDYALVIPSTLDYLAFKGDELLRAAFAVLVFVGVLQLVERMPRSSPHRTATAVVLMLAAAVFSTLLMTFALPYEPVAVRVGASATTAVWFWYTLWMNTLVALLALVIVDRLRTRRQAIERLADHQERGRIVRRRLAYAQLQTIQARVDPQLLFDMLAAVKRYYEHDVERAEYLLDELTAFLRAALPRLRTVHSSLEIEFGLVGCYVRMLRAAGDAAIELKTSLPATLANAMFPAGVLLPLLARRQPAAVVDRCIELDAQADVDGPLRVSVSAAAAAPAAFEQLRASLADLYGERARLYVHPLDGSGAQVELEVPREYECA
jgi:hypothetical protein